MKPSKSIALFAACLSLTAGTSSAQGPQPPAGVLPNPILYLTHIDMVTIRGENFTRYNFDVLNKDQYPAAMFAQAPGLPPCGANANASRSWVDFFANGTNRRIYGYCALGNPSQLGGITFSLREGEVPPSYVYIEIIDRQTNTKYRSNLAETVM